MAITHFQTGVSWHLHTFKDEVLKLELGVISANLRLRVRWLSHQTLALSIYFLPRYTPFTLQDGALEKAEWLGSGSGKS